MLNKNDREIIAAVIQKEIKPISELLQQHHQTIYGANGDPGIVQDFQHYKKKVMSLIGLRWWIAGLLTAIASGTFYAVFIK